MAMANKIERKWMAHYIDAAEVGAATPKYVLLGDDLEEYSPSMSAEVEKKKNILGQSSVVISGYEKQGDIDPYYAKKGDALFERLQEIIDEEMVLDQLATTVVEVKLWEDEAEDGVYPAVCEKAYLEVTSYGGDTTGYQIPFSVHYAGDKVKGTFNVNTKKFTPATEGAAG